MAPPTIGERMARIEWRQINTVHIYIGPVLVLFLDYTYIQIGEGSKKTGGKMSWLMFIYGSQLGFD